MTEETLMTRLSLLVAMLAISAVMILPRTAQAGDPAGMWLSQDGDVKMKVSHCGNAICGNIAWLKHPNDEHGRPKVDKNNADPNKRSRPILGSAIVLDMKPDGANQWSGPVYNAEDGRTYSGSFIINGGSKAELKGCVAIICKSKSWTRTN
jgi:uncharacterized protein (DUF2147 family)